MHSTRWQTVRLNAFSPLSLSLSVSLALTTPFALIIGCWPLLFISLLWHTYNKQSRYRWRVGSLLHFTCKFLYPPFTLHSIFGFFFPIFLNLLFSSLCLIASTWANSSSSKSIKPVEIVAH